MAKQTENKNEATVVAQITKTGELSPAQIDALKAEHNVERLMKVTVVVSLSEQSICYLKPAGRDVTALALSKRSQNKQLEAGEAILDNCFVGGDTRVKNNEKIRMAAAMQAFQCIDFLEAVTEEV